jgi:hypothetical protein
MPPLLSVLLSDCVRKCLIEGPQHSSIRSFVSAHDLTRRPRFSSSSAPALCSLHFSLRGTPLASPSCGVLLFRRLSSKALNIAPFAPSSPLTIRRDGLALPAAAHRRSAHYTPPSGEHHSPLLRTEFSFVGHCVARTKQRRSARSFVLAYDPARRPRSPHNSAPALPPYSPAFGQQPLASPSCGVLLFRRLS